MRYSIRSISGFQKGSGWIIDQIKSHYINVTLYRPLNGSSYIELPKELQNSAKGLIDRITNVLDGVMSDT